MSHLRAPATRADRREGGRHGRPVARPAPALPETHIRPQLMRLAVLPPTAVALGAVAAVVFCVRSSRVPTTLGLWAVLAGALVVAAAGIAIAAVAADRTARSVGERVGALRRGAARGEADLRTLVDALRKGEAPPQRKPRRRPPEDADDFELLAADLARAHDGAVTAVVRAAQLSSQAGSEQKLEVFVNLARRLQSLVHREISILDELENEIEDPDLLKGLFHVDHLATRIRRHAENLAVLGGAVSRRQWSNPVDMTEVLRSAIAEVEQYSRVKLVPPIDGELRGHAVADVIHLLAELVENATVFSAPQTQVLLRANLVTSGLAVEVEDRGLGMPVDEQHRMNALLADPDQVNVASLLADGRIGLYVVSQLARRHGIGVRLQTNIYGGVQAVLVIPQALLGPAPGLMSGRTGEVGQGERPELPQVPSAAVELAASAGGSLPASASASRETTEAGAGTNGAAAGGPSAAPGGATAPGGAVGGDAGRDPGAGTNGGAGRRWAAPGTADGGTGRAPGSGRGRHAQGASRSGDTPPPLPTRGAHDRRANPAEAVPGVSAEDRSVVEANMGALRTPRVGGPVRGTMERPRLPRRRAQEHIVPQLRGGPAPRQDGDTVAGHDPGLMAAFQRGIGLAETQQHMESTGAAGYAEAPSEEGAVGMGTGHMGPGYVSAPHVSAPHVEASHMGAAHMATDHMALDHMGPEHTELGHTAAEHMEAPHMAPEHMAPEHMVSLHMEPREPGLMEPTHMERTHMESAHMSPDPTPATTHTPPPPYPHPTDDPPHHHMDAPPTPTPPTPSPAPDHHDASPPSA
ncbi:ATP-binding protein [Streptomyces sp. NPDC005435]|uniref:ATP-binding protein n=1 Tax=Streptomyces sp. NPDC005435 TaxID=3154464 RepID=UPI003452CD05